MERESKMDEIVGSVSVKVPMRFEALVDILANGFADRCGFDDIRYSQDDYVRAKAKLMDQGVEDPCMEEVQAQMLVMGLTIELHMAEEPEDEGWHRLEFLNVLDALTKYDADPCYEGTARDVISGDPHCRLDFYDYDAILQYACYGQVLIG